MSSLSSTGLFSLALSQNLQQQWIGLSPMSFWTVELALNRSRVSTMLTSPFLTAEIRTVLPNLGSLPSM